MSKEKVRVWVHPKFKSKLKKLAADSDIHLLDLTEQMGSSDEEFCKPWGKIDGYKKKKYNFRI